MNDESHSTPVQNDSFDPIDWALDNLKPRKCATPDFIYDHMESQSGRCLAHIYEPFDNNNFIHFSDRGITWDFILSTGGGKILDFGPGDGWPSLVVAPFVQTVIGCDGSKKRVVICKENAIRMGIDNTQFVHVEPDSPLPFDDASFDGVMAASSLEQTPDPKATLAELLRVLKPGGRLRMFYEALGRYKGKLERDVWVLDEGQPSWHLVLYKRDIANELVHQIRLTVKRDPSIAGRTLHQLVSQLAYRELTPELMVSLADNLEDAAICTTTHPSGETWQSWLIDVGFSKVTPTRSGGAFAKDLYRSLAEGGRHLSLNELDDSLKESLPEVVNTIVPIDQDPPLTATK